MLPDKEIEHSRYELRASRFLSEHESMARARDSRPLTVGAMAIPEELRAPYLHYERLIAKYLADSKQALEICAGTGQNSACLLSHGQGKIICSDISEHSLRVLKSIFAIAGDRLSVRVADIELLPFDDQAFDLVACAGGLSYGDPKLVMQEIKRVLRPGGHFVCVDSFNENPIYRFNRWLHYLRGERTKSTLQRMPRIITINAYKSQFSRVNVTYFGALAWASPVLKKLIGTSGTVRFVNEADRWLGVYRSAFKFVMVAEK